MSDTQKKDEVKNTPAEDKARAGGWVPEEDWKGEAADWVEAKEFNLRGELMGRIKDQSGALNNLKKQVEDRDHALQDLKAMQSQIAKKAYNDAMKDLKKKKVEALEAEDYEGIVDIDEEMGELKANKPSDEPAPKGGDPEPEGIPPEVQTWLANPDNNWYHTDDTMHAMAEGIAGSLIQKNPNIAPSVMLAQMEAAMRKELPHKFTTNNGQGDVDAGGGGNGGGRGGNRKPSFNDLDDEQKKVATRFEKIGLMSKSEYVQSLVDAGEL